MACLPPRWTNIIVPAGTTGKTHIRRRRHCLRKQLRIVSDAVFCGLGFYDACSTHAMAVYCPGINIHVVGLPAPKGDVPSNITYHDEIPFADTIPFIKYADCGLYTLLPSSRPMQAYTDSLKVMQYRYCGLPIAAPNFLDLHHAGVFYYKPGRRGLMPSSADRSPPERSQHRLCRGSAYMERSGRGLAINAVSGQAHNGRRMWNKNS